MIFPDWVKNYIGLDFDKANCWQLVCRVYKEQFNIELPFLDNEYQNSQDRNNIKNLYNREIPRAWQKVHPPVCGDVIVLRIQGQPWHCGIVIANNHMLHTQKGLQAVIEKFSNMIWKQRIIGFYRYIK